MGKSLLFQGLQLSCGGPALRARDKGACALGRDLGMNSKKFDLLFHVQNCSTLAQLADRTFSIRFIVLFQ
jgi:hypothetical protein